jgi:frataxin-like iron-binding protein CyaY
MLACFYFKKIIMDKLKDKNLGRDIESSSIVLSLNKENRIFKNQKNPIRNIWIQKRLVKFQRT